MTRPRLRRLRDLVVLITTIAVTAAGLAACGAGRDAMGTDAGPCFAALPIAATAVGGRGEFAGVRLIDVSGFTARNGRAMHELLAMLPVPRPRKACLVAYAGRFTPGQVRRPLGAPPPGGAGRYAIAVVTVPPRPRLLATFVVRRAPLNFSRPHVGF